MIRPKEHLVAKGQRCGLARSPWVRPTQEASWSRWRAVRHGSEWGVGMAVVAQQEWEQRQAG